MESEYPEDLDTETSSRNNQNPEDFVVIDRNKTNVIPWTEFTVKFKSGVENYSTIEHICEQNRNKVIDLRPYIEARPYTCF